jgi:hypothetical protein
VRLEWVKLLNITGVAGEVEFHWRFAENTPNEIVTLVHTPQV